MNNTDWPFADPPHVATITTSKVIEEGHPILLVTHDADAGMWQFLCGTTNNPKDGRVVGLSCMLERDASIAELADLPLGWRAWRKSPETAWERCESPPSSDD